MSSRNKHSHMDQKIFDINLPIETISVYLLCCSLADNDAPITTRNLMTIWNSTEKALLDGLADLEEKNILGRILSNGASQTAYQLKKGEDWRID